MQLRSYREFNLIPEARHIQIAIIFCLAVCSSIFICWTEQRLSADACVYLNIGKNIFWGKGPYCSYNFYHYWPSVFYPALPFKHPVFPIVAGFILRLFNSYAIVSCFNVIVSGINCCLLYLILSKSTTIKSFPFFTAMLVALISPMRFTAIYPWTEQLHLCVLLLTVFVFAKEPLTIKRAFCLGLLIGAGCLVRVANIYNIIAFALAILLCYKFTLSTVKMILFYILGIICVLLPYELFCFLKYGNIFPEYSLAAKTYGQAIFYGGRYLADKPVLQALFPPQGSSILSMVIGTSWPKLESFVSLLTNFFGLIWFLPLGLYYAFKQGHRLFILFAVVGILHIFLYSFTFWWDMRLEVLRYSLIPTVFLWPLNLWGLYQISLDVKIKQHIIAYVLILLLATNFFYAVRENYLTMRDRRQFYSTQYFISILSDFVKSQTKSDDLVSITDYQYGFILDRPVVSLPEGKLINDTNMENYFSIYKPQYLLINNSSLKTYRKFIDKRFMVIDTMPNVLKNSYTFYKKISE